MMYMKMMDMCMKKCMCKGTGLLIIRLALGVIFLAHGISKLMALHQTAMFFSNMGIYSWLAYVVAIIETLGGIAMILGIFTRFFGVLLAIVMIGVMFIAKAKMPFFASELELMLFASALGIVCAGPGMYALGRHCCGSWRKSGSCSHCMNKDGVCEDGMCKMDHGMK